MMMKYRDRKHAGILLGQALQELILGEHLLVLGIPRGGFEVAYYTAKILEADLSIIVSKKLPYPGQKELAFGAISEDLSVYITPLGNQLHPEVVMKIIEEKIDEIEIQVKNYRCGIPLPDMEDKTVIIVDDGIATGATLVPALKLCRKKHPKKLMVAVPVSGNNPVSEIYSLSDAVCILSQPKRFYGVGQAYEDFHGLNDEEVKALLN
ncbi:phosphoribosyltransferase [soil metagenome]